ncbi:MAG: hypothetical protein A3E57_03310 [Candidatus Muproteobacteria bacterium RIFCSPHIGHO2_12_FULL_60_33]|nr:MAG: hypothetical protein A3E57_03310 [Candidatus Muproteobacteria bacterium RIFCSPHIGHO2_12_FULL_60_33]
MLMRAKRKTSAEQGVFKFSDAAHADAPVIQLEIKGTLPFTTSEDIENISDTLRRYPACPESLISR